jgi:type 1 glutamine amidotransferase
MTLDESSYKDGKMGDFHPIAWYQVYDGIKVFYTGLGHTKESLHEPNFQKQIIGGLKYVLGY